MVNIAAGTSALQLCKTLEELWLAYSLSILGQSVTLVPLWMLCSDFFYLIIIFYPGDVAVQLFMGLCLLKLLCALMDKRSCVI